MKRKVGSWLRLGLWAALILLVLLLIPLVYVSLRYSPEYMVRDMFMDLGTPYDYRYFPERKLTASAEPFRFAEDAANEAAVRAAFESNPAVGKLETFLENTGTQAFLVIRDDTILYERYFMGYSRDSVVTSFSVAKSFDSAMIGIGIEQGLIQSVDEPITRYIPELALRDARFEFITIRHLLTMSSGLRYDSERPASLGDDALTYTFDDLRHLALTETEVVEEPGMTFVYNNYNPLLLGMILERAAKKPVTTYLQESLWTPLGMEYGGSWSMDSEQSGFEKMESGINARAVDFAKLGRLYLKGGAWDGKQILPASWVKDSTQDNGLLGEGPIGYGYMWWRARCNPASQDFFAAGNFGQFVYVSPAKNLVIVRNGDRYGLQGELGDWGQILCDFAKTLP